MMGLFLLAGAAVGGALLASGALSSPDPRNPAALLDPFNGKGWMVAVAAVAVVALVAFMVARQKGWL